MPTSKLEKERKLLHYANVGKQIKEGRHVGLDFYDLLIEALIEGFECNRDITTVTLAHRRSAATIKHKLRVIRQIEQMRENVVM
jgi:hypothetical protein